MSNFPAVADIVDAALDALERRGRSATRSELEHDLAASALFDAIDLDDEDLADAFVEACDEALDVLVHRGRVGLSARGVYRLWGDGLGAALPAGARPSRVGPVSTAARGAARSTSSGLGRELRLRIDALGADGFARFVGELLRESGFVSFDVGARDAGGSFAAQGVQRLGLAGFRTAVQVAAGRTAPGAETVRALRAACDAGAADRGLVITRGRVPADVVALVAAPGAPIDLVDGAGLAEQALRAGVGVRPDDGWGATIDDTAFERFEAAADGRG